MPSVQRFEDLIAWQKARVFTKSIYQATKQSPFREDKGLCSQIQRAAVSIMSNIAEGYERSSKQEFHRYLSIAKASCAEVRSQLYIAFDLGYISSIDFRQLLAQSEELGKIVGGLRMSVQRQLGK